MRLSLTIALTGSLLVLAIAPTNAAPKSTEQKATSMMKVLDPDVRVYAPAGAKTYRECQDKLRAQGVGPIYQWDVCTHMGYKS